SSRRRHTRFSRDWSSDVCSSDLGRLHQIGKDPAQGAAAPEPRMTPVTLRTRIKGGDPLVDLDLRQLDPAPGDYAGAIFMRCDLRSEERRVGKERLFLIPAA